MFRRSGLSSARALYLVRVAVAMVVSGATLASCTADRDAQDEVPATPSADAGTAAFCDQAIRILDLNPGDDPLVMDRQMSRLAEAAGSLDALASESVLRTIERVRSDIDVVMESRDPGGWSSVPVARHVAGLCDEPDVIGWTIQP